MLLKNPESGKIMEGKNAIKKLVKALKEEVAKNRRLV